MFDTAVNQMIGVRFGIGNAGYCFAMYESGGGCRLNLYAIDRASLIKRGYKIIR